MSPSLVVVCGFFFGWGCGTPPRVARPGMLATTLAGRNSRVTPDARTIRVARRHALFRRTIRRRASRHHAHAIRRRPARRRGQRRESHGAVAARRTDRRRSRKGGGDGGGNGITRAAGLLTTLETVSALTWFVAEKLRQRLFSWRLAYYGWRVEFNFVYQLVTDQAEYFNTPFSSQTE